MSLAMKCDRCGKLYEFYDNGDFNGVKAIKSDRFEKLYEFYGNGDFNDITAIKRLKNRNYIDNNTFDLCPECRASFDKWLHLPEIGEECY